MFIMDNSNSHFNFSAAQLTPDNPWFYPRIFSMAVQAKKVEKENDPVKTACLEEYDELSKQLDRSFIQESTAVRNVLRTRAMAKLLITEKEEINFPVLAAMLGLMEKELYSLGPQRQHDSKRQEHIVRCLKELQTNKELQKALKSINKPLQHKYAEQIIRDALNLPHNTPLTDVHAKQAALSAWLCYLRQSVGSCFATAPAIIVHDEQPLLFFSDLMELLNTGRLKTHFRWRCGVCGSLKPKLGGRGSEKKILPSTTP